MLWPFSRPPKADTSSFPRQYSVLIDTSTGTVLTGSVHIPAVVFLEEHLPDTTHVANVTFPNYRDTLPISGLRGGEFASWKWGWNTRQFSRIPESEVKPEFRERSRIATAKLSTISNIMILLTQSRQKLHTGVEFQETVYLSKKLEAQAFKASGYDENRALEFPYVLQYADFAHLSLKQAADDILFKARLDEETLAKTELLRLKYFNAVRSAKTEEELSALYQAFMRECFKNALV